MNTSFVSKKYSICWWLQCTADRFRCHLYIHMLTNINHWVETQHLSGCVGAGLGSKSQNSSFGGGGKIKWFFHFYRLSHFPPWTIKWKQHAGLGEHWKKLVLGCIDTAAAHIVTLVLVWHNLRQMFAWPSQFFCTAVVVNHMKLTMR